MKIRDAKHIHFTGIKGVGMTSLALCIKDLNIKVTGSDIPEIFVTDEVLERAQIEWVSGFSPKNISDSIDIVITTGAHGGLNNPEVLAAREKGIFVMTHAEAIGQIGSDLSTIGVCGVGGKTSTCSILATLFDFAKLDPSFAVGVGNIFPLGVPGHFGKGKHFIVEADEFAISPGINNKPRFSYLNPKVLIVTNVEHDHPDIYPTYDDTKQTFIEFFQRLPDDGLLIANIDNKNVSEIIRNLTVPVVTYGFSHQADWRVSELNYKDGNTYFILTDSHNSSYQIMSHLPGEFNALNTTAAIIAGLHEGIAIERLIDGVSTYLGCRRRFEYMGDKNDVKYFDDYAHHPEEIKATLKAAKAWFPGKRIVTIFQPHTYSRTKVLLGEFSKAFADSDVTGVMDIYASARETKDESINAQILVENIKLHKSGVYYTQGHADTLEWLSKNTKPNDIVLTLGAGDIFHIYSKLFLK